MSNFTSMNYVYCEEARIVTTEQLDDKHLIGQMAVAVYLELDPNQPAAERKILSLAQATELRDDLTRVLTAINQE